MNILEDDLINLMSIFKYTYNVCFIIFFAVVMSRCSMTYGMTQRNSFKRLGELFLVYIIESVYVELVEIFYEISPEATVLLNNGMDIYISGLITAAEVYIFVMFIDGLLGKTGRIRATAALCIVILMTAAGYFLDNMLGNLIIFNIYSMPMLAAVMYFWHEVRKCEMQQRLEALKFRYIINICGIFSLMIFAENLVCEFVIYGKEANRALHFLERRVCWCDDMFSIILGLSVMWITGCFVDEHMTEGIETAVRQHLLPMQQKLTQQEAKLKDLTERNAKMSVNSDKAAVMQICSDSRQLSDFCRSFGITEREGDILKLLIEGKSNQEIADRLLISIGTVKAHVHSIYGKLEVTRRSQLMNVFATYEVRSDQDSE